jgi:serine/threonine protein kinase
VPLDVARLFAAGERIGRYEVVRELGFGGMAAVYAARLRSMANVEKTFAIKVLLPHLRTDREFVSMFLDEARIAVLLDHPNVAHVFELGEDAGTPYLVMEYLRGQSLHALLRRAEARERPLGPDLALLVLAEAALGLHAAHELRAPDGLSLEVVHRDVSPQNIHIAYDGRVRVVDFGIARARGRSSHTVTGQIKGKFRYCSPEQITRSDDVDRRADVWALGVMLWEIYAREPLFRDGDEAATLWNVMNKTVPSLSSLARDVPPEVDQLVAQCLERDVHARPRSALEVARTLRAVADARGATPERLSSEMRALFEHEILEADVVPAAQRARESGAPAARPRALEAVAGRSPDAPWSADVESSRSELPTTLDLTGHARRGQRESDEERRPLARAAPARIWIGIALSIAVTLAGVGIWRARTAAAPIGAGLPQEAASEVAAESDLAARGAVTVPSAPAPASAPSSASSDDAITDGVELEPRSAGVLTAREQGRRAAAVRRHRAGRVAGRADAAGAAAIERTSAAGATFREVARPGSAGASGATSRTSAETLMASPY